MADHDDDAELLAAAGADSSRDDDAALLAEGGGEAAPKEEKPGFFARAGETIKGGVKAAGHALSNVAHRAGTEIVNELKHPIDAFSHPEKYREPIPYAEARQFARGLDDVTSLGWGQRGADALRRKFMGETPEQQATSEEQTRDEAPDMRVAGQVGGMFLPNIGAVAGGAIADPVIKAIAPGATKLLGKLAASRGASLTVPAAKIAGGVGRGLIDYELTAAPAAAAMANAEGHRLEAAANAATDPAGIVIAGGLGTVAPLVNMAKHGAEKFVEHAVDAEDKYIAKDIVSESKGASTATARKQMARAAKDFPEVIGRDRDLREAIGEARGNDLGKVQNAVDVLQDRLNKTNEGKPEIYKAIDRALPDGGVKMNDVVQAYKSDIKEWEHGEHGGEDYSKKIADKLRERLKVIMHSGAYGAKPGMMLHEAEEIELEGLIKVRDSITAAADVNVENVERGEKKALARKPPMSRVKPLSPERAAALAQVNARIGEIETAAKMSGADLVYSYDPEAVISTARIRKLATDAQNEAFMGEGSINGTERYKRALDVASTPTKILDSHLSRAEAGAPDAVKTLERMDRDTHALLAAKTVLDQRLSTAKQNSMGAGGAPAKLAHTIGGIAHQIGGATGGAIVAATGHPIVGGAMIAASAVPTAQRIITQHAAKFGRSEGYDAAIMKLAKVAKDVNNVAAFVGHATAAGLAAKDARDIWNAAHPNPAAAQGSKAGGGPSAEEGGEATISPEAARAEAATLSRTRDQLDERIKTGRAPEGSAEDLSNINKRLEKLKRIAGTSASAARGARSEAAAL